MNEQIKSYEIEKENTVSESDSTFFGLTTEYLSDAIKRLAKGTIYESYMADEPELTKEEIRLLNRIDIKQVEDYYYFMTPKQMEDIRFDLIKQLRPNADLTVSYNQGLVIIK